MLVRVIRDGGVNASPLRSGEDYCVLEVYARFEGKNYYRIDPMDGSAPALFDARGFSVTSPTVSRSWVAEANDGSLFLRPAAWSAPGFWEAYFDDEDWAGDEYLTIRNLIMEEAAREA
ncbi:hypothetical protein [Streptomyces sp. KLMMK]|uniref:hypothetical protein n=1 Tax=Streptomyces sp. KLMMK TaxID=3109353 RepID=UPI00300B862C